jgi:hypothetical protein
VSLDPHARTGGSDNGSAVAAVTALLRLLANPADHLGHVGPADPSSQSAGVLVAQHAVFDPGHHRHAPPQGRHPTFRTVEVVLAKRSANSELEQRCTPRHQISQRPVTRLQPQIAGIHPVIGHGDE